MTILVSHQAVPQHFTTKLHPYTQRKNLCKCNELTIGIGKVFSMHISILFKYLKYTAVAYLGHGSRQERKTCLGKIKYFDLKSLD